MQKRQGKSKKATPQPTAQNELRFEQLKLSNPCENCREPMCCKMLLIPYRTPETFMDLDGMKYMLGFPGINMILYEDGTWQIQVKQNCRYLNAESRCVLHETPDIPKTCTFFNPYNCFYKRNFLTDHAENLIVINHLAFKEILDRVGFDDLGNITAIPSQEEIGQIAQQYRHAEN